MPNQVMELLRSKYLISPISYKGLIRKEELEYPEAALREAILNAIVHKDYTDTFIQLSVYDDKLLIWNPGILPEELSIELLKSKHPSKPRNKNIAEVFFKAGYIEAWGRGISQMIASCKEAGLPEPVIEEFAGGIQVTFQKDVYTEDYLKLQGLTDRQVKTILYTKRKGKITNKEYQELFDVSRNTASNELRKLAKAGLLLPSAQKGAGSYFTLK